MCLGGGHYRWIHCDCPLPLRSMMGLTDGFIVGPGVLTATVSLCDGRERRAPLWGRRGGRGQGRRVATSLTLWASRRSTLGRQRRSSVPHQRWGRVRRRRRPIAATPLSEPGERLSRTRLPANEFTVPPHSSWPPPAPATQAPSGRRRLSTSTGRSSCAGRGGSTTCTGSTSSPSGMPAASASCR